MVGSWVTEQDRVDGGEQKDWQLWSGALGVQQDFFFFCRDGLVVRRGTRGRGLTRRWKPDGLPEDFQLVIQPFCASVLSSVKQGNTVSAPQSPCSHCCGLEA